MGERTDQIERQIAETRGQLGDNLGELQDKVKSAVDWRAQFQQRPGTLLAVAFGGGVILSALVPSNRSRSRGGAPSRDSAPSKPSDLRKNIDAFTGALIGVAVKQASGFLDSLLPGFHQEFAKANDKSSHHDNPTDDAYRNTQNSSQSPLIAKASA
jgi:hypothetical protein